MTNIEYGGLLFGVCLVLIALRMPVAVAMFLVGGFGFASIAELLSNVVYGRPELGGLPAGFFLVHPVDEPHVGDHVRQMTQAA